MDAITTCHGTKVRLAVWQGPGYLFSVVYPSALGLGNKYF